MPVLTQVPLEARERTKVDRRTALYQWQNLRFVLFGGTGARDRFRGIAETGDTTMSTTTASDLAEHVIATLRAHLLGEQPAELMPDQPWGDIRGMGNRLRDAYDRSVPRTGLPWPSYGVPVDRIR
jgi:hypothetical protein